jgi:hypothetical protein
MAQIKVGDVYTTVREPGAFAGVVRAIAGALITIRWESVSGAASSGWDSDKVQNYLGRDHYWRKVR